MQKGSSVTTPEPEPTNARELLEKAVRLSGGPMPTPAQLMRLGINTHYALNKETVQCIDAARMLELATVFADRGQTPLAALALQVAEIGARR